MGALRAAVDVHDADWVVHGVRDFDGTVGSVVPAVFERYGRVFHPARSAPDEIEVSWAKVARANDRVMHPAVEWGSLTGSWHMESQPGVWDEEPSLGQLPEQLAPRLARNLARHTNASDRCRFGVWDGWGEPRFMFMFTQGTPDEERRRIETERQEAAEAEVGAWRGLLDAAPTFDLPDRRMHLLEAPLDAIHEFYEDRRRPPSIWWPHDRAWCVGTDIDLMTTYIGGSREAIDALLDDEQIEALAVPVDQSITWEADAINPLPKPPY